MLWFGWFGFNGGSALNSSLRSVYAAMNTNFATASGLFTWVLIDYIYLGKWSAVSAASDAFAGLIGITAACGYFPVYFSPVIGIITAFCCNYSTKLKFYINADDGLDAFGLHGIGGLRRKYSHRSICCGLRCHHGWCHCHPRRMDC